MTCTNHERFTYVFLVNEQMWVDICRNCHYVWKVYTDEEIERAVSKNKGYFDTIKAKPTYANKENKK
jgi:hypothetical protein